jgi:hypothetical protein
MAFVRNAGHVRKWRWLCRLGAYDKVPNNSTFSVNRFGRFHERNPRRIFKELYLAWSRASSKARVGSEREHDENQCQPL